MSDKEKTNERTDNSHSPAAGRKTARVIGKSSGESGETHGTGGDVRIESEPILSESSDAPSGDNAGVGETGQSPIESNRHGNSSAGSGTGDRGSGGTGRKRGRPRGSGNGNRRVGSGGSVAGRKSGKHSDSTDETGNLSENIPGSVNFENILPFPNAKKNAKQSQSVAALAKFLSTVYRVPAHMGYGNHWPLSEVEATDLASATLELQASLPKTQQAFIADMLKRYAPIAAWAMIAYAINVPRILVTRELINESRTVPSQETGRTNEPARPDFGNSGFVQNDAHRNPSESTAKSEFARNVGSRLSSNGKVSL